MPRNNIYMSAITKFRYCAIAQRHNLKLSNLIEALVLCMTDDEIRNLKARYDALKALKPKFDSVITTDPVRAARPVLSIPLSVTDPPPEPVEAEPEPTFDLSQPNVGF
ncbi:MAG: hypothetical protein ABI574_11745 [Burkholderiales bacterium]